MNSMIFANRVLVNVEPVNQRHIVTLVYSHTTYISEFSVLILVQILTPLSLTMAHAFSAPTLSVLLVMLLITALPVVFPIFYILGNV